MVWGVCKRVLVHHQDVEDAFQATFLVLACKAARVGRRKLLANWLFGVARRAALNMRAVRARRTRHERLCADPPDVPVMLETLRDDVRGVLDEELARLPQKYRLPLLLCGLEGMTHAEAGKHLGWPTGTVAGRLSRGRDLLRARLVRRGVAAPAAALARVLAPETALAAVPPQLVAASVRSATALIVCGKSAAVAVSPTAATLMRAVLFKMFLGRLWTAAAITLAFATTLGGAGTAWHLVSPAKGPVLATTDPASKTVFSAAPVPAVARPNRAHEAAIRLPADPNAIVLRMDRFVDSAPTVGLAVTVYADGRVVAELPQGLNSLSGEALTWYVQNRLRPQQSDAKPPAIRVIEGRISAAELQGLLGFAIHEQEFLDFDCEEVKADIRDKYRSDGNVFDSNDATTTSFRIQTADNSHEASWFRLTKAAWDFPKVERLLQLFALDQRLSRLYYVFLAGGPERIDAVVPKMNELVRDFYRLYPEVPQLTAADLLAVTPSEDGSHTTFTFSHNKDKLVRNPLFEVCFDVPQQGEPTLRHVIPPGPRFRGRVVDLLHSLPP
jgi:RNA polymerase sigma factor (sigma-70 family)